MGTEGAVVELVDVDDLLARLVKRVERHSSYAEVMAEQSSSHLVRYDRSATVVEPSPSFRGANLSGLGAPGLGGDGGAASNPKRSPIQRTP